ncbi:MAG: glucose-1-phosphate cytidylyltransferase [Dermatophilaceae bacterium]
MRAAINSLAVRSHKGETEAVKAVILAGGLGTRLSEETALRPKPMVEIGGKPILWHIMSEYAAHGVSDFVVCCGYMGSYIKDWFANYALRNSDLTFELAKGVTTVHKREVEDWSVTLIDTGRDTMTGGRLRRVRDYLDDETFFFTYGDGVSDVDLTASLEFHRTQGGLATMTVVQPPGRFGAISLGSGETTIAHFKEKPDGDGAWVNGGYFVLEPEVIDYIDGDTTVWEQAPLQRLALDGQLNAWKHSGFWHPMDTLNDKNKLERLWAANEAPWKVW